MSDSKIDLNEVANNGNLSISITSTQEENPHDAKIRRIKDVSLFFVTLTLVVVVFIFCGYTIFNSAATSVNQKWAMAIDASIVTALLGYITGKKS